MVREIGVLGALHSANVVTKVRRFSRRKDADGIEN
jgi:hypothetical protein